MNPTNTAEFPVHAPVACPLFYRTYSRMVDGARESWQQVCQRTVSGLAELGALTEDEATLLARMQRQVIALPSGRWLWVGGTDWIKKPENFSGAFNCTSTNITDWRAFGLLMDLAMMGCGTGAVLEDKYISQIPAIRNRLNVTIDGELGSARPEDRHDETVISIAGNRVLIQVGDSRQGWASSYQTLLELSTNDRFTDALEVVVDLSSVRPSGEKLKGFGGVANPVKLPELYGRCAAILNGAAGRQLNSIECCLLIDEAASCVVAGSIRRSAGMRQFDSADTLAAVAKDDLWQQDAEGNWRIDPERDALRMANHTRVFHRKPTLEECTEAVRKQFYSGEGAIQWAVEAIARSNVDLLNTPEKKQEFIAQYQQGKGAEYLSTLSNSPLGPDELEHRLQRYGLNPCVTADTWVHTGDGPRQVKDLIGQQHSTYVNGELFSTTVEGFFYSGTKPVLKLSTAEGHSLRLTGNHKVLKVTAQTQYAQYTEWVEAETLQPGDRILLHNHRGLQTWDGKGTKEAGWLLGNLLGDGSLAKTRRNDSALLRFWGESQKEMSEHAIALLQTAVGYERRTAAAHYHRQLKHRVVNSSGLARLAAEFGITPGHKVITNAVEQGSYEFYQGFLQGLFDADGSVQGSQAKGISVRLAQSNLANLQAVQRMLGRLGIVATIYQERRSEGYREMPDSNREPAPYFCQAQHDLVIANDNLQVFAELIGFQEPAKTAKLTEVLGQYKRRPNRERFTATVSSVAPDGVEAVYDCTVPGPARFDANGLVAHNCGEIISSQFHCNLSEVHLNQIDPHDYATQNSAFRAAALSVAVLLNQKFLEPRYQHAREFDPIVGVSFTGLFDFFVNAFGVDWLRWWEAGRPEDWASPESVDNFHRVIDHLPLEWDTDLGQGHPQRVSHFYRTVEQSYLTLWKDIVHKAVWDYCDRHGLKRPNRCTTVQPAGSKSLLTGASPGWHPPKAQRFIRRVTFRKGDPVALACIDYGYTVVPSQSDKDDDGNLLNDPFDPRCTEWLVEIPVEVPWANLPGADEIAIERFTVAAQFDFYMQVQKHYATHNVSSTLEMREGEIDTLAGLIYNAIQNDEGYISSAILARFDDLETFPRLPFEPIDKATYEALLAAVLERRTTDDFHGALAKYDAGELVEAGPAGCDSDKCMMPEKKR